MTTRLIAAVVAVTLASEASAQCNFSGWRPVFPAAIGPANAGINVLLTTGSPGNQRTYAGGAFTQIAGRPVNRIGYWDGAEWQSMGAGFDDGSVNALVEIDHGNGPELYAAGTFTSADGVPMNRVAKWTGGGWAGLGDGLDGTVSALAAYDSGSGPQLYATGSFQNSGDRPVSRIARWDGVRWQPLGLGLNNSGNTLDNFTDSKGSHLYVGGRFSLAGGLAYGSLAKWDGASWSPAGTPQAGIGVSSPVNAAAVFDDGSGPSLYMTGPYYAGLLAGGSWAHYLYGSGRWTGDAWQRIGWTEEDFAAIFGSAVVRLSRVDWQGTPTLVACGGFSFLDEQNAIQRGIARLSGGRWSALLPGRVTSINGTTRAATSHQASDNQRLIVAGSFSSVNGRPAANIAAIDTASGDFIVSGLDAMALAVAPAPPGEVDAIVIGGNFTSCGRVQAQRVVLWDGVTPRPLGDGFNQRVNALVRSPASSGGTLFAGGRFTRSGNRTIKGVATWDGANWQPLGTGIDGNVLAMAVDATLPQMNVVAAGSFSTAGGVPCANVARWDGQSWHPIGAGFDGPVHALQYFGEGPQRALYAGGAFSHAGEVAVSGIARWDGTAWSAVDGGVSGNVATVYSLTDASTPGSPLLVVGGSFGTAGPVATANVAVWTGKAWQPMGAGLDNAVFATTAAWSGDTTGVFAGGVFGGSGGSSMPRVARWDGEAWRSLGGGPSDGAQALCIARLLGKDLLFVGGAFLASVAGDPYIAAWRPCVPCSEDINDDGLVNGLDLGLLLAAWGPCSRCDADLNADAQIDGDDLGVLLAAWGACPG